MTRSRVAGLAIAGALIAAVVWSAAGRAPVAEAPTADAAGLQTLVVPAGAAATLPREQMTLTVLSGKLERLNAASRLLSLRIRFANHGARNFDRTVLHRAPPARERRVGGADHGADGPD